MISFDSKPLGSIRHNSCHFTLKELLSSGNNIQRMSGLQCDKLGNLVTLELRGNKLETTDGIQLPNLRRLYLV